MCSGLGLPKSSSTPEFDEGIIPRDGCFKVRGWHGNSLVFHNDLFREIRKRVGLKKETSVDVNVRRYWIPFFTSDCVGIEDRPDRAAAIVAVADAGKCRVDEIVGIVLDVLGVEITSLGVRIERFIVIGGELLAGLVIKALTQHVHQDDVLPVSDLQARGPSAIEHRAAGHPTQIGVAVLGPYRTGFRYIIAQIRRSDYKAPTTMPQLPCQRVHRWRLG